MKISLNWLREYIDLTDIPTSTILDTLTMIGLEVEDAIDQNEIYKGFVVGFVKDKQKHPNADKLSVCIVDDGTNELQVVCGAPNVAAGQKIIFAPIGTEIPNGKFKIAKAKIRGTESFGMICSDAELGLSEDHSGIKVLDNGIKVGLPITEALKLNDVLLEIGITPNRPDALSHIGIARDLAAVFGKQLKIPAIRLSSNVSEKYENTSVKILDTTNCPRYSAKIVKNISVKESPDWLKQYIVKIGMRPINNIVDITNYIMYECGQPLHAFDLDLLAGKSIVVKPAAGTSFKTLDGKERKLEKDMLMICDEEKEVAVAGVMGGENSEIINSTKNILIESAYFNPSSVRKTAKRLGLSTDASYRFERGIDPSSTAFGAERAADLISEIAGGNIEDVLIDVYPDPIKKKTVVLRFERIKKVLGYEVPVQKVTEIIINLGFTVIENSKSFLKLEIPLFRPDIEREIDVIEEIARINGYDNIPPVHKINISLGDRTDESLLTDKLRDISISLGLFEMINNPMQHEKSAFLTGTGVRILNPLSVDMEYLRSGLLAGALTTVALNNNRGEKNLALFEIGNIFNRKTKESINSFDDFIEETHLLILLSGYEQTKNWISQDKVYDIYSLKGLVESILAKISLDNVLLDSYYVDGNSNYDYYFEKTFDKKVIGSGGKISGEVLKQFDIQQDVFCFEFNLNSLGDIKPEAKYYKEPGKYPKVMRDFAFIFDKNTEYLEVRNFILKNSSEILKSVELFDIFESDTIGADKKSLAFSLEYQSDLRTLTEEEVEKDFNGLINSITKRFNAKLRGN